MIEKMLEVKKQIYMTKSWKRRNDLEKHLKKLERKWYMNMRSDGNEKR